MKKSFALILALCMLFTLSACAGTPAASASGEGIDCSPENPYLVQIAHADGTTDASVVNLACNILAEKIAEKSGGAFTLEVFGGGALGTESECIDGLGTGTVQMSIGTNPTLANLVKGLSIIDMPYVFSSQEDVDKVVNSEVIGKLYDELYDTYGIKVLATCKSGFKNILTSYGFVNSPADLAGKKFRAISAPVSIDIFNYLGGSGTGMAMSEVITALQQGTIDGLDNPICTVYSGGLHNVAKYYTLTRHAYNAVSFCMSRSEWEKMSEEQQNWWLEAAKEAAEEQIAQSEVMEETYLQKMIDEGCNVSEDVDEEAMRAAVEPMYEAYRSTIGGDVMDAVLEMVGKK